MAKPAWACFLSAIVLTFICAGIYAFIERADVAKATLSEVNTIVGVDTNTTGNDATHVGTIDRCVSVSLTPPNNTFNIDLFVKDVTDLNFWDGTLSFDETKIHVNSPLVVDGFFLGSDGYPNLDCDEVQGVCQVGNKDTAGAGHTGSGVLGRLELTALTAGTSKLYFTLWEPPFGVSGVTLWNPSGTDIGDLDSDTFFDGLVFNAIVVVGAPCPTDADKDGFTNVEESVDGSDMLNLGCHNTSNDDDNDDSKVNDGCPPQGTAESGAQCDNALDDDADTWVNDGCPVAGTSSESSTPEMCDIDGVGNGKDNDLDGLANEWYDRGPVNGIPDCQELLSDTDDDDDGFSDVLEAYLGTDSLANCPGHPYHLAPQYPYHSAWPLDINNDKNVTVAGDVLNFRGLIGTSPGDGEFRKRLDLNADQLITVAGDVLKFRGLISTSCS